MKVSRRAYLVMINNVRRGLLTRTQILDALSVSEYKTISEISEAVRVTSNTILYHLKNMEREKIVKYDSEGKGWKLIKPNQMQLTKFMKRKSRRSND
ncbi:MAG: helix-turn-helix domain-containing protein [Candidatus Lokiarchaeota archaeon]|nr:helix-turn-helix domain-containing protein [Candidatus Lokiarchaeota archaeon]